LPNKTVNIYPTQQKQFYKMFGKKNLTEDYKCEYQQTYWSTSQFVRVKKNTPNKQIACRPEVHTKKKSNRRGQKLLKDGLMTITRI